MVTVKIENTYSDGHTSTHEVELDSHPPDDVEILGAWFEDIVWPHTGDGHGEDPSLHAHYLATIVKSDDQPDLVGEWFEWV